MARGSTRHRTPAHRLRPLPGLPRRRARALRAGRHTSAWAAAPARSPSTCASHQRETVGLPESIDPTLGALVEPLAVGLHAVERAHIRSGDKVLVVGAGPVGLSVIAWAARSGAGELVVSDPSAVRREAAEQFGATRTVDPEAEPLEPRYDVVIECVGLPGMTDVCVRRVDAPRARRDRRRVHQARSVRARSWRS